MRCRAQAVDAKLLAVYRATVSSVRRAEKNEKVRTSLCRPESIVRGSRQEAAPTALVDEASQGPLHEGADRERVRQVEACTSQR